MEKPYSTSGRKRIAELWQSQLASPDMLVNIPRVTQRHASGPGSDLPVFPHYGRTRAGILIPC